MGLNDKPCVKCGGTERGKPPKGRVLGACKACLRANGAKYYAENHEKAKARNAKWAAENPEKMKAYSD